MCPQSFTHKQNGFFFGVCSVLFANTEQQQQQRRAIKEGCGTQQSHPFERIANTHSHTSLWWYMCCVFLLFFLSLESIKCYAKLSCIVFSCTNTFVVRILYTYANEKYKMPVWNSHCAVRMFVRKQRMFPSNQPTKSNSKRMGYHTLHDLPLHDVY